MARIRSIHPDACESHTLAALPADVERTWWRLLIHTDDHGRGKADPTLLASHCYLVDPSMDGAAMLDHLRHLARVGLINLYEHAGRAFYFVASWAEYQHPKTPSKSRHPDPDSCDKLDPDRLTLTGRLDQPLPNPSPTPPQPLPNVDPLELGGGEGVGGGVKTVAPRVRHAPDPDSERIFEACWLAYPRRDGKLGGGGSKHEARKCWAKLKPDERRACEPAVEHYRAGCALPNAPLPAHFATWLHQRRWEDWLEPATPQSRDGPPLPTIDGRTIAVESR